MPLDTLYLLGPGQERACPAAACTTGQSAAGAQGPGHASRSPTKPPPTEHSWIPDKGQGWRGSSALFAPPPHPIAGSVPATLGSSKSLPQPEEPRLAQVWPPRTALLFPLPPGICSDPFLVACRRFGGARRESLFFKYYTRKLLAQRGKRLA